MYSKMPTKPKICIFIRFGLPTIVKLGFFMQTKHLCILIHIWTKVWVVEPWNGFKPSSKIFLLTVPRRRFYCGSFMLFSSCFCYAYVHVCLLMPWGRLLGKGWPLGFPLWCLIVKLSLSCWYPVSGLVLDCIDSWSLPSFLLYLFLDICFLSLLLWTDRCHPGKILDLMR